MQPSLAGFRDFLPLVLFLIFWWIAATRKKSTRKGSPTQPGAKNTKVPSMQELLRQVLTGEVQYPQPPQRASRAAPPASSPPDDGADFEAERLPRIQRRQQREGRQQAAAPVPRQPQAAPLAPMMRAVSPTRPGVHEPVAVRRMRRADLRRAVIWSEILGTPKALRD